MEMETNEVFVYDYLRAVQGTLIPHFLYHGSDFNQVWPTAVTSDEGESLASISERQSGRLSREMKEAVESLQRLHRLGVLHGDVALRNAVWRQSDRAVLWVGFDMFRVREDFVSMIVTLRNKPGRK